MTRRSIEIDPPEEGQLVWLIGPIENRKAPIEWHSASWKPQCRFRGYTHWSPCEPPADLPPAPKTAFEEWWNKGKDVGPDERLFPGMWIPRESARPIFEAGLEWGKAKG